MEEQLKPTIENPFASPAKSNAPGVTRNTLATQREPNQRKRTFAPSPYATTGLVREQPVEEDYYDPGYFVSRVTRRNVTEQVNSGKIDTNEVPGLYNIAKIVGQIFDRPTPTSSDLEVALEFRNVDTMKAIAAGEKDVSIVRSDPTNQQVIPMKERIMLWRRVAEVVLSKLEAQ